MLKSETNSPAPEGDDFRLDMSSNTAVPSEIADYFPVRLDAKGGEDEEDYSDDEAEAAVKVKAEPIDGVTPPAPEPKPKAQAKRGPKQEHTGLEAEERRERRRVERDHEQITKEFNMLTVTGEGERPEIENKLYFFQLPGIAPQFERPEGSSSVPEPSKETTPDDPDDLMTVDDPEVKEEGEKKDEGPRAPEGQIGRLRLHKSGRLTMVLGDIEMEVTQGTEFSFLQEVVVLDKPEKKAYSVGQVAKRMVLSPDVSQF